MFSVNAKEKDDVACSSGDNPIIIDDCETMKCPFEKLLSLFSSQITREQIQVIFNLSGNNFDTSMECLLSGPTTESIVELACRRYESYPVVKISIDEDDVWADLVSYYKASMTDHKESRIRIRMFNMPAIDTGGVRRQIYTTTFREFAENKHVRLFDGPPNHLRPFYSAEARSSALFKVFGTMVGHSILQDGIGFPYFSPLCYWYIAVGEEAALQNSSLKDVGEDVKEFITKVWFLSKLIITCGHN